MLDAALKQRTDAILVPENLSCLGNIPVNTEIWRSMQPQTRASDASLQQIHKAQAKGLTPLVNLADRIVKHLRQEGDMPSPAEVLQEIMGGLGILLAANHLLHRERCKQIQPELKDCYKELSKKENPISGVRAPVRA
jgi:hypothetical protein